MDVLMGASISTTGDEHRLRFLETAIKGWRAALPSSAPLFVTVDGSVYDEARVVERLSLMDHDGLAGASVEVYRVGQPGPTWHSEFGVRDGRLGVAASKNTGLELLMAAGVDHLFLSDDDTWPLTYDTLVAHTGLGLYHSIVGWGKSRRVDVRSHKGVPYAVWSWPRGVVLYQDRVVVETVGGMDEAFGPGGHEHVEFSNRVYNAGLTPAPFVSPAPYADDHALGARRLWHAEDMLRVNESRVSFLNRKRAQTSVRHHPGDWDRINAVMEGREGGAQFVPFAATENGRRSGTLSWT